MGRGSTVALAAAAAAALLVSLPMLLVSLPAADPYEQESRRMSVEWKAKNRKTYTYAGEEECRYAVFKESRRRVAWSVGASSGLNGFSATTVEEFNRGYLRGYGEESYEQETAGCSWGGRPSTARPTETSVRRSAGTGCSWATAASSSGSTPPLGKTCTASTNSATSPTRRSNNAATRRRRTES